LYHVSFINRQQRMRVGIEYQPTSRWFLDRSKNGGGTLMDWAPYDFTSLNDVLSPVRVDVVDAWMSTPITALDLPEGTVFDVEEHAGASLRYHLADGSVVPVTYERAACTHGEERSIVEIEGLQGAVSWDWLCFEGKGHVTHSYDQDGNVESNSTVLADESKLGFMDKPLVYFYRRIQGEQTPGVVNEQAVFNFSCIRAIYDCATSGQPQSVVLGG
jgi:predicted dehydrogenase